MNASVTAWTLLDQLKPVGQMLQDNNVFGFHNSKAMLPKNYNKYLTVMW